MIPRSSVLASHFSPAFGIVTQAKDSSAYLVTERIIIEPTLELREANAGAGANFHVKICHSHRLICFFGNGRPPT
jgi:hypothetical protein